MAWSKMYILSLSFLDFFCEQFNYRTGFEKKFNWYNIAFFWQILKEDHTSFPMMYHLLYLDIQTWDLERVLVFKYPNRDRVKGV